MLVLFYYGPKQRGMLAGAACAARAPCKPQTLDPAPPAPLALPHSTHCQRGVRDASAFAVPVIAGAVP